MTVKIQLSQGFSAEISAEDYDRVSKYKWYVTFSGNRKKRYAIGRISGRRMITMHRYILNVESSLQVDHIDGNGLNNTRENLRLATGTENQANGQKRPDTTSKFKGVSWDKRNKQWRADICKHYKRQHLGYFTNEVDAARAYDTKALELFGEFAKCNFL